jgi:hypothetical protein
VQAEFTSLGCTYKGLVQFADKFTFYFILYRSFVRVQALSSLECTYMLYFIQLQTSLLFVYYLNCARLVYFLHWSELNINFQTCLLVYF